MEHIDDFKTKQLLINEKISQSLKLKYKDKLKISYNYKCTKCDTDFSRYIKIRKNRNIHCDKCIRKVVHFNDLPNTLYNLSSRTVSKILKRANVKCMICDWDKTSLDIHHIVPKKNGGSNEDTNLICLCPNCHRLAHEQKIDKEILLKNSVNFLFKNWKEFYYPGDGPIKK